MAGKTRKEVDAEFDAIIAELGDPVEVETDGPGTSFTGDQDIVDELARLSQVEGVGPATLAKITPTDELVRTIRGAITWGREQMTKGTAIWTGLCLMFVRMCFNVDPLFPDAITAWEQSSRKHPCTPAQARRGHGGFFRGGDHGHAVLCLGNGRCLSTDIRRKGMVDVVMIADIERAWGYKFLGDVDELNGEIAPRRVPQRRRLSDRAWRIRQLRRAVVTARANGNPARAKRLREWLDDLRRR